MDNESIKELEWKEPIEIQDGKHTGIITRVEFRDEPYEYTDVFIKLDDVDVEVKYGCPTILSTNSKLGRLLIAVGETFEKGKKAKPSEVLKDKKVEFMTINKKNKDGKEFANVVEDSIKLV